MRLGCGAAFGGAVSAEWPYVGFKDRTVHPFFSQNIVAPTKTRCQSTNIVFFFLYPKKTLSLIPDVFLQLLCSPVLK